MPPWGRPPGGRMGKKAQREWARRRSWDERRFEEIEDSEEDDDDEGVELALRGPQRRHVSDELRFTGIGLDSSRVRRRKGNSFDQDSDSSDESEENDGYDERGQSMQIILREKEDFLVERALERIRHARLMGKTNVKLSRAEVDALERAERAQKSSDPSKVTKGRKAVPGPPQKEERKKSKTDKTSSSAPLKANELRRKARSSPREDHQTPYSGSPAPDYSQASGAMVTLPQVYPAAPPQRPKSSRPRSGSRTTSSQSLRQQHQQQQPPSQHSPPLPHYQQPYYYPGRYFSNPSSPFVGRPPSSSSFRSDPSDPSWEPRARSTSNLVPYPVDQPSYPTYPPPPPQFDPRDPRFAGPPGPRTGPRPPDMYNVSQIPEYRHPHGEMFMHSPSPSGVGIATGDDDVDSDDEDGGVEVNVVEQPGATYGIQTRSSAAASASRGRGAINTAKGARRGK